MIKQLHNLAPEDGIHIASFQCTVLSDGNVIQKHWKSSFHSFSFSVYAESWQLFLWTSLCSPLFLSFLPFTVPPFPSPFPLSFFFLFFLVSFLLLSQSLPFILLDFVLLNMNYLRVIATEFRYMHMALYLMLPTVLIRLHLLKSVLKFYLRIKPHVVIRVLEPFLTGKKKKRAPWIVSVLSFPLCYFLTFFYSSQVYWTGVKSQHLRTHTSFFLLTLFILLFTYDCHSYTLSGS